MAIEQRLSPQQLANGLGWFSIGLGLAEIPTPNFMANLIGITDYSKTRKVLRLPGARTGCGIRHPFPVQSIGLALGGSGWCHIG